MWKVVDYEDYLKDKKDFVFTLFVADSFYKGYASGEKSWRRLDKIHAFRNMNDLLNCLEDEDFAEITECNGAIVGSDAKGEYYIKDRDVIIKIDDRIKEKYGNGRGEIR